MVIVEFDFIASSPSELSLEAGDIIELIGKRDDGWWRGRCQGKEGLFPSNFVVELDPDDDANLESLKENAATGHSPAEGKIMRSRYNIICYCKIEEWFFIVLYIIIIIFQLI